jgi:predicted transcriptional regulator
MRDYEKTHAHKKNHNFKREHNSLKVAGKGRSIQIWISQELEERLGKFLMNKDETSRSDLISLAIKGYLDNQEFTDKMTVEGYLDNLEEGAE